MPVSLVFCYSLGGVSLVILLVAEIMALLVYLRLRFKNRRLFRRLILDPFSDVEWTAKMKDLSAEGDSVLVQRVLRLRVVRQVALLGVFVAVAVGGLIEFAGY